MNSKVTKSVVALVTAMLIFVSAFVGTTWANLGKDVPTAEMGTEVQQPQQTEKEPQPIVVEKAEDDVVTDTVKPADKVIPVIKTENTVIKDNGSSAGSQSNKGSSSESNKGNGQNGNNGSTQTPVVPDTAVTESIEGIVNSDSTLAQAVTMTSEEGITATVPAGVKVNAGAKQLTLTITSKDESDSDVTLEATEKLDAYDVHIEGVAKDNTTPIAIDLGEVLNPGLNKGNLAIYHVENGETVKMSEVDSAADFTAHNQFAYNPENGALAVAMTGFSEVAVVADTTAAWEGEFDYSWYNTTDKNFTIANADQLAAFGAIVGGMNGQTKDSFEGKTVKLISDINLGDKESENNPDLIFYPIGYYNSTGSYEKTSGGSVTSSVSSFEGTFDGNGHTISNFYQNTWEMFGDYNDGYSGTPNHYKDAMGLFGYVVNGTVKNLTLDNFSSDGEYTPTGVIAAYAVNSTFENIAITNCNPRVYNTGNGGIVGIGGNSDDPETYKLTFTNITIDNTNKITALWGSWDVACGGLVGMFRGAGHVDMTNCHVAAQLDVYNDVCGNYQYYWYRYSGMMVGTNKNMTTDDKGYTVPETDKFHAENCTVHFGDWNNYWYCELVANSLASYTHDHQFSRLTQVDNVDVENKTVTVDGKTTAIPTSGRVNYVVVNGDPATENATCYHFVDGKVWSHEDAGKETVNGNEVLKENNQHIYLPFNQLFTGYGWGVKHIPVYNGENYAFEGITILDREVADSVVKFEGKAVTELPNEKQIKIGKLFNALEECDVEIKTDNVQVTVSPADDNSTVTAVYKADTEDWRHGTILINGTGNAKITITDYYFCETTTIDVEVKPYSDVKSVKFVSLFTGDFLYRVGNAKDSTVALSSLFDDEEFEIIDINNIDIGFETVAGNANGTFTENTTDWTKGIIQFSGTGVVKVTITDNDCCIPTVLYLEVVDAVNATTATNATANNVVLLNDINSGFTVSGDYTLYGNGFTLTYTGNGQYLNNGLKQGVVTVSENGTLDNVKIKATIYPNAYMYYGYTPLGDYVQGGPSSVEGDKTRYHYQLSAVAAKNNATISNCYIYGGRTNIFVDTGDVTIKDTVTECGTVANIQLQSTAEYTVTLDNVTTIQHQVNLTIDDTSKVMLGAGVLVGPDTTSNPTIVLNGDFKQYNWVTEEDAKAVSDTKVTKAIIDGALDAEAYNHVVNGKTASNLGIIYMNMAKASVTNKTTLPYELGEVKMTMAGNTVDGQVYSLQKATAEQIYSDIENADRTTVQGDYIPTFDFDLGNQAISYDGSEDTRYLYGDANGVTALYQDGDASITLDLTKLAKIYKYDGINYDVTAVCKDANGNVLADTNGLVTLDAQGEYTLEFTVNDKIFYDKDGKTVEKSVERTYTVPLALTVKAAAIKNATVNITKTALDGVYTTVNVNDYKLRINFLDAISVTDYDNKGTGSTVNLSSNISSATLTPSGVNVFTTASTITITYTDGRVLTVNLSKISGSSPGTKTATVNTSGYFITDGALNNKPTETKDQNKCTITSVSYKGNSGSTVTNDTDVTVTWELGSSSGGGCVTPETLITLADGTQKQVQHLTGDEELLVWNLETGSYDTAPIVFVDSEEEAEYEVINLTFSDGSEVGVIYEHGFFDLDLGKYVYIDANNCKDYIGHRFVTIGDIAQNSWNVVTLDSAVVETRTTTAWSPVTFKHLCYYTDGVLSMPGGIEGLFNIFEVDTATMSYDKDKMIEDFNTYGVFTYEDFEDIIPPIAYAAFNGEYLKVAIGKGLITWETIESYAERYIPLIPAEEVPQLLAANYSLMALALNGVDDISEEPTPTPSAQPTAPAEELSETEELSDEISDQQADNGADDSDNGADLGGETEEPAEELVEEPAEELVEELGEGAEN